MKRVVITGRGVVSPLGSNLTSLMDGLEKSKSGVLRMPGWEEYKGLNSLVGAPAELKGENAFPRKVRRSMGRLSVFAALAAKQAAEESKIEEGLLKSRRLGCIMASTMGSAEAMNEAFEIMLPNHDLSQLSSMGFFKCVSHTAAMNIAQALGVRGYVMATSAACASSLQALGLGYELIRSGRQDVLLCGGAEELHPIVTGIFEILFATSTHFNDTAWLTRGLLMRDETDLSAAKVPVCSCWKIMNTPVSAGRIFTARLQAIQLVQAELISVNRAVKE